MELMGGLANSASKSGIITAITLNTTAAGVLPQFRTCGRLISIFMCEHKNIKMSNQWQPFTDTRRRQVSQVFYSQVVSFDMTSLAGSCA